MDTSLLIPIGERNLRENALRRNNRTWLYISGNLLILSETNIMSPFLVVSLWITWQTRRPVLTLMLCAGLLSNKTRSVVQI